MGLWYRISYLKLNCINLHCGIATDSVMRKPSRIKYFLMVSYPISLCVNVFGRNNGHPHQMNYYYTLMKRLPIYSGNVH